ncbi:MAG: flagellar FliJ family protein [Polyangiaceae bacterium]
MTSRREDSPGSSTSASRKKVAAAALTAARNALSLWTVRIDEERAHWSSVASNHADTVEAYAEQRDILRAIECQVELFRRRQELAHCESEDRRHELDRARVRVRQIETLLAKVNDEERTHESRRERTESDELASRRASG